MCCESQASGGLCGVCLCACEKLIALNKELLLAILQHTRSCEKCCSKFCKENPIQSAIQKNVQNSRIIVSGGFDNGQKEIQKWYVVTEERINLCGSWQIKMRCQNPQLNGKSFYTTPISK